VSVSVSIGLAFYFADTIQKGRQAKKHVTLRCSVNLRLLPDTLRKPLTRARFRISSEVPFSGSVSQKHLRPEESEDSQANLVLARQ
jgi:hypothetical protein